MKPMLLVDCYLDDPGAHSTYAPLLSSVEIVVARASREPIDVRLCDYSGVVISGSSASIVEPPPWVAPIERVVRSAADRNVPVFGVCFGHQVIARALYGPAQVRASARPELGWLDVERVGDDSLMQGVAGRFSVFLSHLEEVCPHPDLAPLARSADCALQAFRVLNKPMWGVQFHLEMSPAEARTLVAQKARLYPERNIDVDTTLARATDTSALATTLFSNFLAAI